MSEEKKLKGIGGWLYFFIVSIYLAIFYEIIIAGSYFLENFILLSLCYFGIAGITIYIAWSLQKKKVNSIHLVNFLLWMNLITGIILISLNTSGASGTLIGAIVWLIYFSSSKRVKNTFPKEERKLFTRDYAIIGSLILLFLISTGLEIFPTTQEETLQFDNNYLEPTEYIKPVETVEVEETYELTEEDKESIKIIIERNRLLMLKFKTEDLEEINKILLEKYKDAYSIDIDEKPIVGEETYTIDTITLYAFNATAVVMSNNFFIDYYNTTSGTEISDSLLEEIN